MLLERTDRARAEVRERADVENRAAARELGHQAGILHRADPVAQPVGAEGLESAAHRRRPGDLAGMRHRGEAERLREREGRLVRLRRELRLEPAEPHSEHSPVAVFRGVADDLLGLLGRGAAEDVRCESHLDAVQLARLHGAVAVAAEDLVPGDAPHHALGRREDCLEVDGPVRRGLGGVAGHDLAEVLRRAERIGGEDPDLDEVGEVAEPIERLEVVGQRIVVPLRDRAQRVGPHRPLEVDVQLDLRVRRSAGHRTQGTGACASASSCCRARPARRAAGRGSRARRRRPRRGTDPRCRHRPRPARSSAAGG